MRIETRYGAIEVDGDEATARAIADAFVAREEAGLKLGPGTTETDDEARARLGMPVKPDANEAHALFAERCADYGLAKDAFWRIEHTALRHAWIEDAKGMAAKHDAARAAFAEIAEADGWLSLTPAERAVWIADPTGVRDSVLAAAAEAQRRAEAAAAAEVAAREAQARASDAAKAKAAKDREDLLALIRAEIAAAKE